ncbi:cytochrome P450 [Nocardia thraciensis]
MTTGFAAAADPRRAHHNERVWDRPGEFDPTRYLPENLQPAQKHASLPFGAGKQSATFRAPPTPCAG